MGDDCPLLVGKKGETAVSVNQVSQQIVKVLHIQTGCHNANNFIVHQDGVAIKMICSPEKSDLKVAGPLLSESRRSPEWSGLGNWNQASPSAHQISYIATFSDINIKYVFIGAKVLIMLLFEKGFAGFDIRYGGNAAVG